MSQGAPTGSSYDAVPRRWVDANSGEEYAGKCPDCSATRALAEDQMHRMELELRAMRGKLTKAERAVEHAKVARRDGAVWEEALGFWLRTFPDKRPSSVGIKSARATKFFERFESISDPDPMGVVRAAVLGAKAYPYVVYGSRTKTGPKSALATDLQELVHVGQDHLFDFLVEAGRGASL
jgi:hypothetical protein